MKISDLKGKKVTVMGLGLHGGGVGTIKFLAEVGAKVTVTDIQSKEKLQSSLEKIKGYKNIQCAFNQHRIEDFTNTEMIIKSPPIPWSNKHIKAALEKDIPVEVDSSLFFKLCPCPIIGISGTKGKSTTSSLIWEILEKSGKSPIKVGISQISVLDKLLKIKKNNIAVFELSSWRLSALGRYGLSPQIAVFLNIFPDHLNYYKSFESYLRDKKFIFKNQKSKDTCILNADIPEFLPFEKEIPSEIIWFSKEPIKKSKAVFLEEGKVYFNNGVDVKEIIKITDLGKAKKYPIGNIMAAIAVALKLEVKIETIKEVIASFKGISHRLELVREIDGVKYVNDTAATTPESAIFGINSFSQPLVLIAGGADKNFEMEKFAETVLEKTKKVILLKGKATDKLLQAIKKKLPEGIEGRVEIVDSMNEAVSRAKEAAKDGEVVLLSPGAASFGIFDNEFDRGNQFKEAVEKLK